MALRLLKIDISHRLSPRSESEHGPIHCLNCLTEGDSWTADLPPVNLSSNGYNKRDEAAPDSMKKWEVGVIEVSRAC